MACTSTGSTTGGGTPFTTPAAAGREEQEGGHGAGGSGPCTDFEKGGGEVSMLQFSDPNLTYFG